MPQASDISPLVYSNNAIWDITQSPYFDPISQFPSNAVVNPYSPIANFSQSPTVQQPPAQTDYLKIAIFAGVFLLVLVYLGTWIAKEATP